MRVHNTFTILFFLAASILGVGCGAQLGTGEGSDTPIPASEPRANLRALVDLHQSQDCEQAFDLELYQHRSIELLQWDETEGQCSARKLEVKYLPRRMNSSQLQSLIRQHAKRAEFPRGE